MGPLQNGCHMMEFYLKKDPCPLKDENSFVSDLKEIANSDTHKWNGEIQKRKGARHRSYALI
jgi:hypothetical protein